VKGEEGRAVSAHGGGVKLLKIAGEKEERVWESMTNSLNPITASSLFACRGIITSLGSTPPLDFQASFTLCLPISLYIKIS